MYTVLIADDEKIERNGIRQLLKNEIGSYRILEAANGREAEKIIQENKVDILLTDIRMPYVSGLELAKWTAERSRGTEIIIFSGYHDFTYAKSAIQYGVQDYILKPVDPEEFGRAFLNVRQTLAEKKERLNGQKERESFLNQYFLLNYILSGNPSVRTEASAHIDTVDWDSVRYMILLERSGGFFEKYDGEFQRELTGVFGDQALCLGLDPDQLLLLVSGEERDPVKDAEYLSSWLRRTYGGEFYMAVSRKISSEEELPGAYRRLDELMEEKFYHTERFLFCESPDGISGKILEESCLTGMLEKDIRNRDAYHIAEHFRRVAEKYSGDSSFPSMYVKFVFTRIIKVIADSSPMADSRDMENIIEEMYRSSSVDELIAMAKKELDRFCQLITEDKSSLKYKVEMTKDYIQRHYGDDIPIDHMAAKLCISPGYLSMVFKKEAGENIKQYIRNVRMEKAKELLSGTQMSVREIGGHVGYRNMSYFSRCFRQQFGSSPESYRRENQAGTA